MNALIKCVQLLKPTYKALIIVPDGLLEAPSLQAMREWLLCSCKINAIISLPKFSFAPYTKEKTYVLFIQKRINHIESIEELKSEKIYAYIVDNDGHANSDKRYRTSLKTLMVVGNTMNYLLGLMNLEMNNFQKLKWHF